MRKTNPQPTSKTAGANARRLFLSNRRGRIAALFILAIALTAASVATMSFAQSKRRARRAPAEAEKLVRAQRPEMPGRSEREREEERARERGGASKRERDRDNQEGRALSGPARLVDAESRKPVSLKPTERKLNRAHSFDGDLRELPFVPSAKKRERFEREMPAPPPALLTKDGAATSQVDTGTPASEIQGPSAPVPGPIITFPGLDFAGWGAGHPPDTVGDVGPNHYIQSVNSSVGIYNKSTGAAIARFTLDTFMSQGNFGNLCDTDNFGDPVVLYDTFEDRWIVTDFAFQLDASDNVVNPPGAFQCFAVSKTGDPVSGGWNFYSINTTGGLGDYPKLGVWHDGIYMSLNMFDYAATGSFQNTRVYAFNKAQMYAGEPTVQSVEFNAPSAEFSLLPSNARLQTGTPPAGSPNYFSVVWQYLNVISVYKFKVDWNNISTSTFTGPFDTIAPASWANSPATVAASTGGTQLDTLGPRLMMQNQYTNLGGVESLWNVHTVQGTTAAKAAVRYYQQTVTGGTIPASTTQAFTHNPDVSAFDRYMPSLAVDRAGDMAIGYTASSSTSFPSLRYVGRLSTDAVNTLPQTEQVLFQGTGTQNATYTRWGDYSAMSLDPDGCTFWYTNEYYATTGTNDQTRVGSFKFTQCTPVGNGTISGTVTATPGGTPIAGATVTLGSRSANTDANGQYSFTVPAGTYPGMTASFPGRTTATASNIVVADGGTTTKDFALAASAASGCLTDTTQADFQAGVPTNTDLTTTAGSVILAAPVNVDQHADDNGFGSGYGFSSTSIIGQTFTPAVSGQLRKIDVSIFCASCSGTNPNIILEVRTTSGGNPVMTNAALATATLAGTSSGSGGTYSYSFTTPPTLTAGTVYGFVVKLAANRTTGTQAALATSGSNYAGGRRKVCTTTTCANATGSNADSDLVFKSYMYTGFTTSGDFISSLKDANPAAGSTATWGTFSWTATTPASTTLKFQVAASNNASGPFSFVGTDGTAATFYTTSGGSLAQFNGKRYLKYKALLTGISTASPTLNDVTACFSDVASVVSTTLAAAPATGTYGGTVNLSATLTASAAGVSGKSVAFTLNGNSAGSGTTDANGVATVSNVSLSGVNAGSYPTGVGASFAGDSGYTSSTSTAALTVNKASQTITFDALGDKTYGDADFNVSATASSGLSVSFAASGACTVTGNTVHITGAGSCTVTASQAGDTNYNAAPDVPRSFNIAKASQSITFGALSDKTYGDADFSVSASASSGLTVGFAASGACTVTGSTVHITGAGSCTITASQAGDSNYNAASNVQQSFNIGKASTTTSVTANNATYDGNPHGGTASVTGPAGLNQSLTVSYSGRNGTTYGPSNTAPTNAGDYTASASYAGDSNYNASSDSEDYSIAKASQTITFDALADKTYGDADFNVSASASSGLSVSFNATGDCSVSGSTVHINGAGACTVTASQGGDSNYNAAPDVARSFNIAKANQSIIFAALSGKTYGDADFNVSATATSGLSVSFSGLGACTVTGNTVHITGAGSCTVTASQGGDANYNAAANVERSFDIAKASQTISFGALSDKTYGDADFSVSATATSGLDVSFNATGACTVTGSTVHITGAGSCTITASQPGDSNYNAASDVAQSFNVAKASASVTLSNLSQTYDGTAKSATATTNPAGLNVTFSYAPVSGAGRSKNVSAVGGPVNAGSYTVTATIDDPNYEGSASDTLVIAKANANVSVAGFTGAYDGSPHTASGTATGAQGEDLASLFDFGASYTNVPGGTAHWTFNDSGANGNYNPQSGDVEITISKATPSITWGSPADIVYGTALGAAQLNASANTAGTFTYTPASGTVLSSGNGQNLHANFTPADSVNYNAASADVSINVLSAVLSVSMIADRNPAPVGLNFNYKATITNTGNAPSANTVLTDVLPAQVTFTAASSSQGTCSYASATRTVTCNLGAIPAGGSATVQITVKPREEGTLNDTATITATQWDPATGNDSASVNGVPAVKQIDLSVSKTDSVDPIFVGDDTVYTMLVKNSNGPINATGVTLSDTLPAGMTFVSATTSQGALVTPPVGSTGIVTANIGTMAPNATVTVTVTAKGASAGVQVNSASVSGNETDTNSSNNSATQSTTVKSVVVVSLQKVLLAKQVLTGGCENTTGQVYLTAPAPAGGVNVALSSNVTGASVPSSVFIPAGAMVSPAFTVTTSQVNAKQVGLVTAASGPNSVSRGITINVGGGTCP